jgi:uncharacterized protein (DUF58 family)
MRAAAPSIASIATGAVLIVLALLFGTAPLLVAGVGFAALGVLAVAVVWCSLQGVSVRRAIVLEQVVEGEPFRVLVTLRYGPLGLPGAELHDPLAGGTISLAVPPAPLRGRRGATVRVQAALGTRGLHRIPAPRVRVRDPLGLFFSERAGDGAEELLVLPRTEPVLLHPAGGDLRRLAAGNHAGEDPPAAVELDGLRPYRPGTPATRIHWPALARGAGLLERRLRAEAEGVPLVILDPRDGGRTELLDAAVRAAASLTLWLARGGGCRLLIGGERRALAVERDLRAWPSAHARLALVQGGTSAQAPVCSEALAGGWLLYVAATSMRRPPAPLAATGSSWALVLPAQLFDALGMAAAFEVAGCRGQLWRAPVAGSLAQPAGEAMGR